MARHFPGFEKLSAASVKKARLLGGFAGGTEL